MSSFLKREIDHAKHNEEVRRVLDAYNNHTPLRAPCCVGGSISNLFLNPELNTEHVEFKDFFESVDVQIEMQLKYQHWQRFNIYCDREMGIPENGWQLAVDFQNSAEASWFGCPLQYLPGLIPDTVEILRDKKESLYDMVDPDPLKDGLVGRGVEFFEEMLERCKSLEYMGAAVLPPAFLAGESTDGPLQIAYKLRGADHLMIDMLTDEDYYHDLMTFITRNEIRRIKALKEYRWSKLPNAPDKGNFKGVNHFFFADDAIALISAQHYKEFVYPYHKMIVDELAEPGKLFVHLCGDATRHFKFIVDNLGSSGFDTGFPVDFAWLRNELGQDIQINGGPTVMLVKDGTHSEIDAEVKRIAESGVLNGRRFVFIAANNLAPCTPVENIAALYDSVRKWATYAETQ